MYTCGGAAKRNHDFKYPRELPCPSQHPVAVRVSSHGESYALNPWERLERRPGLTGTSVSARPEAEPIPGALRRGMTPRVP
eukprot:4944840-Prymnesium_polylepis.1